MRLHFESLQNLNYASKSNNDIIEMPLQFWWVPINHINWKVNFSNPTLFFLWNFVNLRASPTKCGDDFSESLTSLAELSRGQYTTGTYEY